MRTSHIRGYRKAGVFPRDLRLYLPVLVSRLHFHEVDFQVQGEMVFAKGQYSYETVQRVTHSLELVLRYRRGWKHLRTGTK